MNKNNPARLHKKEPLTLTYNVATVYLIGALFILAVTLMAFSIGTDNFNYLWSCI